MKELSALAKKYVDELNAFLPDTPSEIEAICLTKNLLELLKDNSMSDSECIDAVYNVLKACKAYQSTNKSEDYNLLTVLKIERASISFLFEAEKNAHFWNRHKGKIIAGFCLLCVIIGVILIATGVGSPFALFLGLFGVQLAIGLPALYAATSAFCLTASLALSGILIGLSKLIGCCFPSKPQVHLYLLSDEGANITSPDSGGYHFDSDGSDPGDPGIFDNPAQDKNQEFDVCEALLINAFFPFLVPPFSNNDYLILKQGLTYRLENTYGYGATSYYLIQELNNASRIMNKDDRFEELCRICGVGVARVDKHVWEEWKNYQDNYRPEENKKNAPSIRPVSGEVARFVILEGKDPYKFLGVSRYASYAEIKKAFYQKALQCHPDKVGENSTETFKMLNTARDLLLQPKFREDVDYCLSNHYAAESNRVSANQN